MVSGDSSSIIALSSPPKATLNKMQTPSISSDASVDVDSVPGPRRPGRKSPFTDVQTAYLDKEYKGRWITYFTKHNARNDRAKCTEWKIKAAKAIMKSENFKGKMDSSKSIKEWRDVSSSGCMLLDVLYSTGDSA